ncbi:MAG: ABC transporter ATP-binding protein [Bacteroidota bacterium]|nr:ABC transporter ATP-binding protein [Bacteroidota bacterium]MDP4215184.1 ABC transporter ATP-binding protein [Bacteroidota bacterium]MDP4244987.1 ABC transporter ATP-binding protein [Bacteroidota bacterium]MDP4255461.1 ABC transporter ATP-binding protein [Bacteroidota bacterium]MDP4256706.1 ABC transporter ATP-binding protein [Bacteroidota bacterium]
MKILLHYLKPYRWLAVLALLLAAINQTFSMLDPYFFGRLLDHFGTHPKEFGYFDAHKVFHKTGDRSSSDFAWGVLGYLGILISVAMVSRIAKAFQDYFGNVIVQKFGATIFTDGLRHSMGLPFSDFEDQRSGETLSTLSKVRIDTERFIISFINVLFGIVVGVIFVSIYSFTLHWSIMPIYVLGMTLLAILTSLLSRKIKRIQKKIVGETNALAGSTTESLRNIELVKSLGLKEQEVKRLNQNTFKILGLELRKVKSIRSLSFIQGTFVNFLRQCIMFVLFWLVFKGRLSPGEVLTMVFYSFFIFGPLQELGNIILSYREAEASLINFDNLMKKPPEKFAEKPRHLGPVRELAFRDVVFKHQTAQQSAIDHISFSVKTGETIAFVGPSGSGKTTLMKLLVGLYRPQRGTILYNNLDENAIDFEDLRRQIGFVTQDTQLFSGTIKENLLFVNPTATESDLLEALDKASCTNLLARAEKGLDTMIGEGGLKLSGGEKQRLSIARALLRKPKLLIFDEATSSLDSLTEEDITRTIREVSLAGDQITILIAHRLSTIMHADRIHVLEKGHVVETGTHEQLLEEKGLYYAMWRQQIGERKYAMSTTS